MYVKENQVQMLKTGEEHPYSKLTKEEVISIYTDDRKITNIDRAAELDHRVTPGTIWSIRNGYTWKTITEGLTPGLVPKNQRISAFARLTPEQACEIVQDDRTQREIAEDYGVSQVTISDIKMGKSWGKFTGVKRKPPGFSRKTKRSKDLLPF